MLILTTLAALMAALIDLDAVVSRVGSDRFREVLSKAQATKPAECLL